jgi:PKD repeat protein
MIYITEAAVVSNFSSNVSSGLFILPVQFTDSSLYGPTAWNWSFGDGTFSDLQNPVKVFATGGNFTIILNASNTNTSVFNPKTGYIEVNNRVLAGFTANATLGTNPVGIIFTPDNLNDNATQWNWSFGDGTWLNGSTQIPTHVYTTGGIYTIIEVASNPYHSAISTRTNYITILDRPIVNFTYNNSGGIEGQSVQFISDSRTSILNYSWNFGDGNTSTIQSPLFTYNVPGIYSVSLSVTNASGTNATTKTNIITIIPRANPIVNFSADVTTTLTGYPVQFTSDSYDSILTYAWVFGDGNTSAVQNPLFTYNTAGTYSVRLSITNVSGSNTTIKNNYITVVYNRPPLVYFTMNKSSGAGPLAVQFNDTSLYTTPIFAPIAWNWTFDDGNFSDLQNPVHTFYTDGAYHVTLNVSNSFGYGNFTAPVYVTPFPIGGGGGGGGGSSNGFLDNNSIMAFMVITIPAVMLMGYLLFTNRKKEDQY